MKKTIFIVTSKLEEALNLGVKLDHLKKTKVDNGIFITNKDLSLERNFSEINQFKNQNNIKIITLK